MTQISTESLNYKYTGYPVQAAYFSMEVGIDRNLPTYSGGLGVLAGDTLSSFADLSYPVVGVTLLYRKGFFNQSLDASGRQSEAAVTWKPENFMKECSERVYVSIEGRSVCIRAWKYDVKTSHGRSIPVFFLDTDLIENSPYDRSLTDSLYAGDDRYRLSQEVVLGIGGVRMLQAFGFGPDTGLRSYHMNEGHAALLTLALVDYSKNQSHGLDLTSNLHADSIAKVKEYCMFTTHTPVPAGHDHFPESLASQILGESNVQALKKMGLLKNSELHMTHLALRFSRFVNGVAKRHAEVSRKMFPEIVIEPITNGVHAESWTSKPIQKLLDNYTPAWRRDNFYLRNAIEIPVQDMWKAHQDSKEILCEMIAKKSGKNFDPKVFTIGFARRAAEYKRGDLLFTDTKRLEDIAKKYGALQVVFSGKSHPKDLGGKALIERIFEGAKKLSSNINVVYLENYDLEQGLCLTSGVDLWLNNPLKPLEASGTSGMKAALNGVPSLSTLDGWWVEGCVEGITGWEIEDPADAMTHPSAAQDLDSRAQAAKNLYAKLENVILDCYLNRPMDYAVVMRNAIALNGSFFNTQRMVSQYAMQYRFL